MKAICHKLQKAADDGLLENKYTLKGILESVANNFHVKKQGKRYKAPFKLFLEVIMLWGGPRLASFVALNIGGPEVHAVYRWRKQHHIHLVGRIDERNFVKLAVLYKEAKEKHGVSEIPVLAAEDETAIIGHITYNQTNDELLGFCGVRGEQHTCLDHFTVVVGEDEVGYHAIMDAFREFKIDSYARAIILNPLHPRLPRIVVLTMPTCNKFDNSFVYRQWQEVQRLYERHIEPLH